MHDILHQGSERTIVDGIAIAHTLTTPEFIELSHLLLEARYEAEDAEASHMIEKMPANRLLRLALIRAEKWEESLADAWGEGTLGRGDALEMAREFREYRLRRWPPKKEKR